MTLSHRHPRRARVAIAFALLLTAGFIALGIWQIERRAWKHRLIHIVEARIHAAPTPPPPPAAWRQISADGDAYRHVRATGHFLPAQSTLVQAVTEKGPGYWVLTPLVTPGFTLLVNRGFVPPEQRGAATGAPSGEVTVTGLLRISEPHGGFLRSNDPKADRWYSRDVAAIAAARAIGPVAPYFIDADATPNRGGYPVGGLTVVSFPDNHMSYALTWFGMAALSLWWAWWLLRERRQEDGTA